MPTFYLSIPVFALLGEILAYSGQIKLFAHVLDSMT